jgi:4-hydroxybenzoyl-CoA reductase subunit beta
MRLPDFQYVEPKSLQEACFFLKDQVKESKIIGGGTDLLPSMKQRIFKPKHVLTLCTIPDLDRIEFNERSGLRIGALVKLRTLEKDPVILEKYPMIAQAAGEVGSTQLREMGTAGGNLSLDTRCYYYNQSDFWRKCRPICVKMGGDTCNAVGGGKKCFAIFSGDLAPALIALGAKIKLVSVKGERILSLRDYYTGDGAKPLTREPEEILVNVEVPVLPKRTLGCYLKYRIRRSIDFPLAGVATLVTLDNQNKVCLEAKVVIGAVGTKPEEIERIEELLNGNRMTDSVMEEASEMAFKAAKPIANAASSPSYRKKMIKVMVEKALRQTLGGSDKGKI